MIYGFFADNVIYYEEAAKRIANFRFTISFVDLTEGFVWNILALQQ
jgi:hypothetical protein